jgi:uncharacterized protein YciI
MNVPKLEPHTILLLRRPDDAPDLPDEELGRLQEAHLEHLFALRDRGLLAVSGPFADQEDEALRGACLFRCGVEEAREAMRGDPSVRAGRLRAEVFTWRTAEGTLVLG